MSSNSLLLYMRFSQDLQRLQSSWKFNPVTKHISGRLAGVLSLPLLYVFYRFPKLRRAMVKVRALMLIYRRTKKMLS